MKLKKVSNLLFIFVFFGVIGYCFLGVIRTPKDVSFTENRLLQKFEAFFLSSFLNGEYQDKLEKALSDQFVRGETIKRNVNSLVNSSLSIDINNICKDRYVNLGIGYYNYNCVPALIWKYNVLNDAVEDNILKRLNSYNEMNKYIDSYYYFINTSVVFDFSSNDYSIDVDKILDDNLSDEAGRSALEFKNIDEYTKMFYKSDHHWNHVGSYKAYRDIISMIYPDDELIEVEEEVVFEDITFLGSSARMSQFDYYNELFRVYRFDYPYLEIINNRSTNSYGNEDSYFNGNYINEKYTNHYANFYGGDSAEVVFRTTNSNKSKVLVLSSSFSNAINKLISSHFYETYIVDLRHYESVFNEEFEIKKYIEDRDIDKVLIIMDYNFLTSLDFNISWGE